MINRHKFICLGLLFDHECLLFMNVLNVYKLQIKYVSLIFDLFSAANISFIIRDKGNERRYCNINKPPEILNSSSDKITVIFHRGIFDPFTDRLPIFIGVRIFYTSIEEPGKHLIDYSNNYPKCKKY